MIPKGSFPFPHTGFVWATTAIGPRALRALHILLIRHRWKDGDGPKLKGDRRCHTDHSSQTLWYTLCPKKWPTSARHWRSNCHGLQHCVISVAVV